MKCRSNPSKASAILTADWHLRESVPVCRTDDFWAAQWKKVRFVRDLAGEHDCPILHAGDLLDHWRASPYLLSTAILYMPKHFYTVLGNHDLPQHNLDLTERSGAQTLAAAQAITVLPGCHMGQTPKDEHTLYFQQSGWSIGEPSNAHINTGKPRKILVWHEGVWKDKPPWPNCKAWQAIDLLESFLGYDLILTGDFHTPCIERCGDRLLVNPGSLMRQTADQIDFKPRVYLWFAETNDVEPIYLPIDPSAVSREHLDIAQDRDKRIEAFVSRLDGKWAAEMSFEANLERFLREHKEEVDVRTHEIIRAAMV